MAVICVRRNDHDSYSTLFVFVFFGNFLDALGAHAAMVNTVIEK